MTNEQIFQIVNSELKAKTLGTTEQYLQIHDVVYENNKPIIKRIDREGANNLIVAYLPIIGEEFYFAVYIDPERQIITGFDVEADYRVYFKATSETMNSQELSSLTTLEPTKSWSKGEFRNIGNSKHSFSAIMFLPNPEPDEFEDKLDKLLTYLEQDSDGIKVLVEKAFGYIQVAAVFHNGNGMIGGPTINQQSMKRLSNLNLSVNFDLYVEGNLIK